MPQDFTFKKQGVAVNAMIAITQIGDGLRLLEASAEDATGLSFEQVGDDPALTGEQLAHLNGYQVNYALSTFLTDFEAWLAANATRKDVFYQMRR
jgi:hypothetical protein